jgi:hypothetical protein
LGDAQKVARVEVTKETLRILQESEANDSDGIGQAASSGFNTLRHPRKCLPARQQMSFRGSDRQLAQKSDDHGVLHPKEAHRVRCSSKRQHIQSDIFHESQISRFANSKPDFSAPEDRVNFLGAHE